jgi:hypothetical protein
MTLASETSTNIVLNGGPEVGRVEISTQPVQRALNPFMAVVMDGGQQLLE